MFAVQPSADRVMVGTVLPVDWVNVTPPAPIAAEYLTESAKYASSAVTRLRRSDFIEARYAFSFVLANFGIAIAAKMPMITTTIRSSINVKPLRFIWYNLPHANWYTVRGAASGLAKEPFGHKKKCGGNRSRRICCIRPEALCALRFAFLVGRRQLSR